MEYIKVWECLYLKSYFCLFHCYEVISISLYVAISIFMSTSNFFFRNRTWFKVLLIFVCPKWSLCLKRSRRKYHFSPELIVYFSLVIPDTPNINHLNSAQSWKFMRLNFHVNHGKLMGNRSVCGS